MSVGIHPMAQQGLVCRGRLANGVIGLLHEFVSVTQQLIHAALI